MSYRSLYSDDEWLPLQLVPVMVFLTVASADKEIDKKGYTHLKVRCQPCPACPYPLASKCFNPFQVLY